MECHLRSADSARHRRPLLTPVRQARPYIRGKTESGHYRQGDPIQATDLIGEHRSPYASRARGSCRSGRTTPLQSGRVMLGRHPTTPRSELVSGEALESTGVGRDSEKVRWMPSVIDSRGNLYDLYVYCDVR